MYHELPGAASFWSFLFAIDQDLAETARKNVCSCGGHLHRGDYVGSPAAPPPRFPSSCASTEFLLRSRRLQERTTPPSDASLAGGSTWAPSLSSSAPCGKGRHHAESVSSPLASASISGPSLAGRSSGRHFPIIILENRTPPFGTDCPDHQPPIPARGRLPQPSSRQPGLDTPAPVPRTDYDHGRTLNQDIALSCDDLLFPQKMSSTCLNHFMEDVTVPSLSFPGNCDDSNKPQFDRRLVGAIPVLRRGLAPELSPCAVC